MKKRFSHEMINHRLLSEEVSNLQREKQQLCSTNETLIKANKRFEEKWQKVFYSLEFYKDFYHKYMDLITKGHATHMKTASTHMPNYEKLKVMKRLMDMDASPEKFIRNLKKADEDDGKHVNISVLEAKEEEEEKENEVFQA